MKKIQYFQDFIYTLCQYWINQGCLWSQPYDQPMGAGTFHPHTFFKALGPEPWRSVYVQPCRRPVDGRYGKSPNRLQYYYQLQVFIKPTPINILDVYLKSLEQVGIALKQNDAALYEDNWKGPTLGAWGLGWEVRANGEEVTQFTYFQEFGGLEVEQTPCEITYGLERLFMYAHGYQNIMDIPYNKNFTYGDIFFQNEFEFSKFNFRYADTTLLFQQFDLFEKKVIELCEQELSLPAYDYVLQASHTFNLLDARGALSVTERQRFIGRVRDCAKKCALVYIKDRKEKDHPFLNKIEPSKTNHLKSTIGFYLPKKISKGKSNKKSVQVVLEIGVEEMPPDFQISALKSLKNKVQEGKNKFFSKYSSDELFLKTLSLMKIDVLISSRRIAFVCDSVPLLTPKQHLDIWGPAENIAKDNNGNLTQAGLGFCKKNSLNEKEVSFKAKGMDYMVKPRGDGTNQTLFLYAQKEIAAVDFPTILVNEFKNYIYALDILLKMRWLPAQISPAFIRPVRWVLCLVENKVLPLEIFGLSSSSFTYGQRVLTPKPIQITHANEYVTKLKRAFVVSNPETRKNIILKDAFALLKNIEKDPRLSDDNHLLEKCIGMSESPYVFLGQFHSKYLNLPPKLIISVLKEHMNYFHIYEGNLNSLLPYYIGVASYKCLNVKSMISSTQKVVESRLEDGSFYFENDLNIPFQALREKLKSQVFQEGLGTLFDKSERLSHFTKHIAYFINSKKNNIFTSEEIEFLAVSGAHSKNDLKTGCVQEFPEEMQGTMGGVLIRAQNAFHNQVKSECIAQAIEEHYFPIHASAPLPSTKWAHVLSIADKLDSLILFILSNYEPKGNQDPFGLRRLAVAVARLLNLKNEVESELCNFISFEELLNIWKTHCTFQNTWNPDRIKNFFVERVKSVLKEKFNPNSVESISHLIYTKPLCIFVPLLQALEKHFTHVDALIAYKRARTLTEDLTEGFVNPSLFASEAESKLYNAFQNTQKNALNFFQNEKFDLFFQELSSLTEPLAHFFDSVLVNDPNLVVRQNRLQLLYQIRKLYENLVDLSVVQIMR